MGLRSELSALSSVEPRVTGAVPDVLARSGDRACAMFNAYLSLAIKSDDTRKTYRSALSLFLRFCDTVDLAEVVDIEPVHVRAYLDHRTKDLGRMASAPTHFFAIKGWCQYMVDNGYLASNPAASVRYAFVRSRKGKTAVITSADVRALLDSIAPVKQTDLRDRALIGLMAYTFVRIGGALSADVGDYYFDDGEMWIDMVEKGAKGHSLPVTGEARAYLDAYIEACGLKDARQPLFQSANRNGELTGKRYDRGNSRRMIARRCEALNIGAGVKNHTFRATGITRFLEAGGKLDDAQDIANHADSSTTRRYDRRDNKRLVKALKQVEY